MTPWYESSKFEQESVKQKEHSIKGRDVNHINLVSAVCLVGLNYYRLGDITQVNNMLAYTATSVRFVEPIIVENLF